MHGGIPGGRAFYHVNISLRDAATNAEIKDAEVKVKHRQSRCRRRNEETRAHGDSGTLSYGNYFRMPGKDPYTITVQVRRPGVHRDVEAKFDFRQ